MVDAYLDQRPRRLGKLFSGFVHQVRVGLGRCEGAGPHVTRTEDTLLQIRLGPDLKLLSLRPHLVPGSAGLECFIHCREGAGLSGGADDPLVAAYRHGASGDVFRHLAADGRSLGILSDSYVAMEIARTLIREAFQRAGAAHAASTARGLPRRDRAWGELPAHGRTFP